MTLKLSIITEGSSKLGLGHLRRCITLKNKLYDIFHNKIEVNFNLTKETDAMGAKYLENEKCILKNDEISDLVLLDLSIENARKYLNKLNKPPKKIICLDWFDPDIVPYMTINLFDHSFKMKAKYSQISRKEFYKEGGEYALIREEVLKHKQNRKNLNREVKNILITMGGADPTRKTTEAIKDILNNLINFKKIDVIIGPFFSNEYKNELHKLKSRKINLIENSDLFLELFSKADLIFCSGGTTLLEAMCLGMPIINYPQTQFEYNHALKYVNLGACVFKDQLNYVINNFEFRKKLRKNGLKQIDGNGAERLASLLKSVLEGVNA